MAESVRGRIGTAYAREWMSLWKPMLILISAHLVVAKGHDFAPRGLQPFQARSNGADGAQGIHLGRPTLFRGEASLSLFSTQLEQISLWEKEARESHRTGLSATSDLFEGRSDDSGRFLQSGFSARFALAFGATNNPECEGGFLPEIRITCTGSGSSIGPEGSMIELVRDPDNAFCSDQGSNAIECSRASEEIQKVEVLFDCKGEDLGLLNPTVSIGSTDWSCGLNQSVGHFLSLGQECPGGEVAYESSTCLAGTRSVDSDTGVASCTNSSITCGDDNGCSLFVDDVAMEIEPSLISAQCLLSTPPPTSSPTPPLGSPTSAPTKMSQLPPSPLESSDSPVTSPTTSSASMLLSAPGSSLSVFVLAGLFVIAYIVNH